MRRPLRAGQSNYAYANGAVDQLVELRRALQLPGLSVQWGPIADVGFVAEVMQARPVLMQRRLAQHKLESHRARFPLLPASRMQALRAEQQRAEQQCCSSGTEACVRGACHTCMPLTRHGARAQGKLVGRLNDISVPQPIDDCLHVLGDAMCHQAGIPPTISIHAARNAEHAVRMGAHLAVTWAAPSNARFLKAETVDHR